jgi:hypothetical protein
MSSTIRPEDFNRNTADPNRWMWSAAMIRHVMAAIANSDQEIKVMVETDARSTGHIDFYTIVGVTSGFCGGYDVVLRHEYAPGKTQDTRYMIQKIGVIVIIGDFCGQVRFGARRSYAEEESALIRTAQTLHGAAEGRNYGNWSVNLSHGKGTGWVKYEPLANHPKDVDPGTRFHGEVRLSDCDPDGESCQMPKYHYGNCKPAYIEA